ncbi:Ribonuclease H domain [Macleaya cordata]|uniref:Ribonuclease H domain n=1 Tax=Macleaya cordata TaxID=56857 RepID=A0A200Q7B9_MACCD|nr:Ribonuclease H domain [Macleaya cordata]
MWDFRNGELINVWNDRWIPTLPLPLKDLVPTAHFIVTVSQLIDFSSLTWNLSLLQSLFPSSIIQAIQQLRIPLYGHDKLRWCLTKSENFSVSSTYSHLSSPHSTSSTSQQIFPWLKLWHLSVHAWVLLFLWKCLSSCLPTRNHLSSFIDLPTQLCPFCTQKPKTVFHLFTGCDYTQAVWFSPPFNYNLSRVGHLDFHIWVKSWFTDHFVFGFSAVGIPEIAAVISWQIWKARCNLIFKNIFIPPLQLANLIFKSLNQWLQSSHHTPLLQPPSFASKWNPLPSSFIKINVDASWSSNSSTAGLGLIARDCASSFRGARCLTVPALDAEHAECLAILHAIFWAQELSIYNVYIEGDNQAVLSFLNTGQGSIHWRNHNILDDAIKLLSVFHFHVCKYVSRDCNRVADRLAVYARRNSSTETWGLNVPPFLVDVLLQDQSLLPVAASHTDPNVSHVTATTCISLLSS